MSIDTSGGMLVGGDFDNVTVTDNNEEGVIEYLYEQGIEIYSPWYDAGENSCTVGFPVEDVEVKDMDEQWLDNIKQLSIKFEQITNSTASLIGIQDVT